jgi:L-aspartate semialdehyde sulfurtransferase
MATEKTFGEINEKIKKKQAVVVTAEEMIDIVHREGPTAAAKKVDVVTTGTFGPMCSSGALINVGHPAPKIKIQRAWLNDVPAYAGLAAVDLFLGATELRQGDPENKAYPGKFEYGGAHVIEDLVRGKEIVFRAESHGTDCYPRKSLDTLITLDNLNEAFLLNPRNCYQNYNVAVNAHAKRPIHTYLGILRPRMANAGYCSAGQLSPLLNDPLYRTIGIGTRIFLGGGVGYVYNRGTQHNPEVPRTDRGVPTGGAGTLAVTGDLKGMSAAFLRGCSITGYGVSLAVGIGVPIPILDEEMAVFTAVKDSDIRAPVVDYSDDYPENKGEPLGSVTYAELRSGQIQIGGKTVRTFGLSSYRKARDIAAELKRWIEAGEFLLSRPAELLPGVGSGVRSHGLSLRPSNAPPGLKINHP